MKRMTERQIAPVTPGDVYPLGKYLVLAELGRGGMAEVYLALSRGPNGFNKLVVLKLLRAHLAEDEDFLRMFLAEARLAARLNHANIVQTYEIGVEGGRHCIVMEYLEGRSLADIESATRSQPMALSLGVRILADTLAALHHAHELCDVEGRPLDLVHRDVSPHNLIVTYDGQVKLLDFGIAKATDNGARTKTGVFKGKLRYTAPERFGGDDCDRRADVFSVGVMLWQLLTRRHMWAGMNDFTVMQQLASRTPAPPPRSLAPDVPIRLDEICRKALAISPDDRFETAARMEDALEEFLAGESVGTTNRALAKFMGEVFGEVRQEFQRTVDEQLRTAVDIPLDLDPVGSMSGLRASEAILRPARAYDSLGNLPVGASTSRVRTGLAGHAPPDAEDPVEALLAPLASTRPPRRWTSAVVMAAALIATTALLFALFLRSERSPPRSGAMTAVALPAAPSPPAVPSAQASAPPSALEQVASSSVDAAVRHPWRAAPAAPVRAAVPVKAQPPPAVAAPPPPATPAPAKREADCSSPYFIDDQGIKKIRTECL
jgi:serine/threonine protein kinase